MRNRRWWSTILVLVMVLAMQGGVAAQTDCPDQVFDEPIGISSGIDQRTDHAQTLTFARAGRLESVQLAIVRWEAPLGTLVFDIRETVADVPIEDDRAVLASYELDFASLPREYGVFTTVDVWSDAIYVQPGLVLALVLRNPGGDYPMGPPELWWTGGSDTGPVTYDRGTHFVRNPLGGGHDTWQEPYSEYHDVLFRTYLDCSTPVVEKTWSEIKAHYE